MAVRVLNGHVVDALAGEPAGHYHCVVTSPPYLWLRSYGTEPQVWPAPGREGPGCPGAYEHEWDVRTEQWNNRHAHAVAAGLEGKEKGGAAYAGRTRTSANCSRCGAWRGELGQEPAPELYVAHLCDVMAAVGRVLRDDGTLWVNLAGCYYNDPGGQNGSAGTVSPKAVAANAGLGRRKRGKHPWLKPLDWVDVPGLFARAMQERGWYWRSDVTWAKPSSLPESVSGTRWEEVPGKGLVLRRGNGRPTKSTEAILLFIKAPGAYFDQEAVREPVSEASLKDGRTGRGLRGTKGEYGAADGNCGFNPAGRNLRDLWTIGPEPLKAEAGESEHYAAYPSALPTRCLTAGTSERGCCPTCGAPWARVVETRTDPANLERFAGYRPRWDTAYETEKSKADEHHERPVSAIFADALQKERVTTGWRPTCLCPEHTPVPCRVLDPFGGSGTTAIAADRLGRDCTLVELKPAYAQLAQRRVTRDAPLFADVQLEAAS
jgi:DNA modification methylase